MSWRQTEISNHSQARTGKYWHETPEPTVIVEFIRRHTELRESFPPRPCFLVHPELLRGWVVRLRTEAADPEFSRYAADDPGTRNDGRLQ